MIKNKHHTTNGRPIKDLTGQRFGRLVVLGPKTRDYWDPKQGVTWRCLCDCGRKHTAMGHKLRSGQTASCGCLGNETRLAQIRAASARQTDEARERGLSALAKLGTAGIDELADYLDYTPSGVYKLMNFLVAEGLASVSLETGSKTRGKRVYQRQVFSLVKPKRKTAKRKTATA